MLGQPIDALSPQSLKKTDGVIELVFQSHTHNNGCDRILIWIWINSLSHIGVMKENISTY